LTLEELEARVLRLEDIEEIKKLMAAFCYADDAIDVPEIIKLFAEDAIADFHPFGHYEGKTEIAKFFGEDLPSAFSFMVHMVHNPVINVNGNHATGQWYYELPATNSATNEAIWISGIFKHEFIKVSGAWKFKRFTSHNYYITPYDKGWVQKPQLDV